MNFWGSVFVYRFASENKYKDVGMYVYTYMSVYMCMIILPNSTQVDLEDSGVLIAMSIPFSTKKNQGFL